MLSCIIEFFVFAFIGWGVDSLYCSILQKKWVSSGYFKGIPLCSIYGFGGILVSNSLFVFQSYPFWLTIPFIVILITLLEYFGGWFTEFFLNEKLWDYSKEKYNLHGYISLWHSFLWLVSINLIYFGFDKLIVSNVNFLSDNFSLPVEHQIVLTFFILALGLFATAKNKNLRLKAINDFKKIQQKL